MIGRETLRNGEKRLYDESVTPRNSPAFGWIGNLGLDFLRRILSGIVSGIGIVIDKATAWVPIPSYATDEAVRAGYKTGYAPAPAIAPGYRTALAREAIPVRIENSYGTRPVYGRWDE